MVHLRKKILKAALVLTLIGGGVILSQSHSSKAISAVYTVEETSEAFVKQASETVAPARKAIQRFDVPGKVRDAQHKTRPIGQKIQSSVTIDTIPGASAVTWVERYMSLPALLLILVFGGVFALLGVSGPSSRLGGRH